MVFCKQFLYSAKSCARLSNFGSSNLKKTLLAMPRDRHSKNNRSKPKEKNVTYTPGTITLQVLGSGALGSPAVLYLFTDQNRYMFNCGEGTQRLAHEHKMKLSRLEHIFLTRRSWSRIGGLPGLSLTIQESGVSTLSLHGPSDLDELFTATKRFVVLRDLQIKTVQSKEGDYFEDNVMTVHYIPIQRHISSQNCNTFTLGCSANAMEKNVNQQSPIAKSSSDEMDKDLKTSVRSCSAPDDTDYYAHERNRSNSDSVQMTQLLKLEDRAETEVIIYICRVKAKAGALNLEKCVELGIKPGPIFGQLKNGLDVVLPDGTIIHSSDVRTPDDPGPLFIVLDIPSEEYLDCLEQNTELMKYQGTANSDEDVASLVVHFSPPDVLNNPRYQKFVGKFSPSTAHLKINEDNLYSGSLAVHRLQHQLHQLDEAVFPLLKENIPIDDDTDTDNSKGCIRKNNFTSSSDSKKFKADLSDPDKETIGKHPTYSNTQLFENACAMTCFQLRPKKGLDRSSEPVVVPSAYIEETNLIEGFSSTLQNLRSKLPITKKEYPRIIFLGTGSCIPNKTRNTSAILVQLSETHNILLDCGEGTFGQFVRHFGTESLYQVMKNLNMVYISHLHADHHIGLIGLLQGRKKLLGPLCEPMVLLAPKQISSWLEFYNKRFEIINCDFELIPNQSLVENSDDLHNKSNLGIHHIQTCLVRHCPHAFGVTFYTMNNKKITYSGDTMPCLELVNLGMYSDLLIHEATMEDDLESEAKYKMHSTVSQAISIGNEMKAKNILLTHFSQRYAKIPRIQNMDNIGNVGLAFDHMEVCRFMYLDIVSAGFTGLTNVTHHCTKSRSRREWVISMSISISKSLDKAISISEFRDSRPLKSCLDFELLISNFGWIRRFL